MRQSILLMVATTLLSACGDGGGGTSARTEVDRSCTSITGGGTRITLGTPALAATCTAQNLEQAIDGNLETAAEIQANAVADECVIRVTAQDGIVFAAGNTAAVFGSVRRSGVTLPGEDKALLRTLLQGNVQEEKSFGPGDTALEINGTFGSGLRFFELSTTKPFDAVEFAVGSPAETQSIAVFEFCSDR
jgi:hypothetical protein